MKIHEVAQGTPEWFAARLGKATASHAAELRATLKSGKEAAGRRNYRTQLVLERITGKPVASEFSNFHMERGTNLEADAILRYEGFSGHVVLPVGFCEHDTLAAGVSPDGLVLGDELVNLEVKCPLPAIHLETIRDRAVPKKYLHQLTHGQWVLGASASVFVSYCPAFDSPLDLIVVPVARLTDEIAEHEPAVIKFLEEVDQELHEVWGLRAQLKASLGEATVDEALTALSIEAGEAS